MCVKTKKKKKERNTYIKKKLTILYALKVKLINLEISNNALLLPHLILKNCLHFDFD